MIELANIKSSPLALTSEGADSLIARLEGINPAALEAYRPYKHQDGERLGYRGDVAILYVHGPLLKRETWLTKALGFTTYETLRQDLQTALDDRRIKSIALHVDSPGGEANGCDELATTIFYGRSRKPINAFVSGMACSGAYWIASAASQITVSESAILGSIGVVMSVEDRTEADARNGIAHRHFVSSKSPGKRPDISTADGRSSVQRMVDELGDVFVNAVAKHRGVTPITVVKRFGAGGVEIGANAVKAGMADAVGQFEAMVTGKSTTVASMPLAAAPAVKPEAKAPTIEDIRAQAHAGAAERARRRIRAILESKEGRSNPELAQKFAFETKLSVEDAQAAIAAEGIAESWRRAIANTQIV